MKLTLSWLKDHIETTAPLDEIVQTLTRIGLEVEAVEDKAAALKDFTIARVIEAKQHPNADRLRVCLVDTGKGAPVQVVCGAPNAKTGMMGVFSPPGSYIPGKKITLGKGVIRGVESNGMLVSEAELEISDDHDGIIELPADAPLGASYAAYAGLDDAVIEINLTPNRPDGTSIHGIARDLAAAGIGRLKDDPIAPVPGGFPCPVTVKLDFLKDDARLCPAFALRLVRGVKNGPSPAYMQRRLKAIGLRPINALVDITNYMTFDRGRPLHVFDAAKVKGAITVRHAKAGETLTALDGKSYTFDDTMVVIADGTSVESIGGVMGGEASGCDEGTTDVLIESALWDALNIASTGRKLGINTDARYRFERGVDPEFCVPGLEMATRLVLEMCGGEASAILLEGAIPDDRRVIDFPLSETKRLTGLDIDDIAALTTLSRLGFAFHSEDRHAKVTPPSWRPDIEGKADLVEEITRIAGLDRVPSTPFAREEATVLKPVLTLLQRRVSQSRRALAARGMVEAVSWSFIAKGEAEHFGGGKPELALANPIASDLSDMRPSLLPGLLKAAQRNADRGRGDVAMFEVGQVFHSDAPEGQSMRACGIRRGLAGNAGIGRHWSGSALASAFDAKADAFALFEVLGIPLGGVQVVPGGPAWFHPGRSARLQFGPKVQIGAFGELHPRTLEFLDVKGPVIGFEITLDLLPVPKQKPTRVKPKLALSDFQPVRRDFAFVVDKEVAAGDLVRTAQNADRTLVADVVVFDLYEGAGLDPAKKSIGVEVTLQPVEKTLTDAEIEAVSGKIVAEVSRRYGATLRG
ncbi:phenylalanyl-tRNA synthetase beta subunit [Rhizobiales bacterium GAS191]|nr:phenylalanyl-tRNA synthetase beta subunit [Rhizobiales bacterium GAS191]